MKKEYLKLLDLEKQKRKKERLLNRGFKPQEVNEEGEPVEDQEILEEHPEFDKKKHEIEMFFKVFEDTQEIFIEGTFFGVEEETVSTPFIELL